MRRLRSSADSTRSSRSRVQRPTRFDGRGLGICGWSSRPRSSDWQRPRRARRCRARCLGPTPSSTCSECSHSCTRCSSGQYDRLREAVKDRLHQSARSSLVPLLREALALEDPDVLGAFLSGAGPSVALLARADATQVATRLSSMYERAGVEATVRTLGVDDQGSRVLESGAVRRSV